MFDFKPTWPQNPDDAARALEAVSDAIDAEEAIHQDLRKSHCDHDMADDPAHRCVGTTIIAPNGVKLSCPLCGTCPLRMKPTSPVEMRDHVGKLLTVARQMHHRVSDTIHAFRGSVEETECKHCGCDIVAGFGDPNPRCDTCAEHYDGLCGEDCPVINEEGVHDMTCAMEPICPSK